MNPANAILLFTLLEWSGLHGMPFQVLILPWPHLILWPSCPFHPLFKNLALCVCIRASNSLLKKAE